MATDALVPLAAAMAPPVLYRPGQPLPLDPVTIPWSAAAWVVIAGGAVLVALMVLRIRAARRDPAGAAFERLARAQKLSVRARGAIRRRAAQEGRSPLAVLLEGPRPAPTKQPATGVEPKASAGRTKSKTQQASRGATTNAAAAQARSQAAARPAAGGTRRPTPPGARAA